MTAVLLSTSRWPILSAFPSGPFCLHSPWISLSFHHSLMSSCSCQHLLTASNSLQHTGSWDPCDELQSAVCRGGFTLSRANQGKHPLPRGRASTDRLSPSYPVITLHCPSAASCCIWTQSAEEQTLCWLLSNLFNSEQQQPMCFHYAHKPQLFSFFFSVETFLSIRSTRHFVMLPTVTQCKCLLPEVSIISNLVQSLGGSSQGFLNFIKASTADYLEWGAQVGAF